MKASEIMTKEVITVAEDISVKDAVKLMATHDVGALIVQTPKPTFGIFTQGDLITRVVGRNKSLAKTKVKDVMSESAKCAQADDSVDDIVDVMYGEDVKYLPVMDGRRLVGIISAMDLFRFTFRTAEGYKAEVI